MNSPGELVVVSITTRNFLHRARALMREVARLMPEARRIVACVDSLDGFADPAKEDFATVDAATLGLPRFRQLAFALDATGLCCALKPYLAQHALALGARCVLYLDNDLQFFRRPDALLAALDSADLVLTPHLLGPLPAGAVPDERTVLGYGTFNAGMFAVGASGVAADFLRWWGGHTVEPAHMKQSSGYDQIWLNYAPAFVPRTAVLRDEGYNVASWNLASRPLTHDAAGFRAGGAPLTAFHFSAFDETQPNQFVAPRVPCNFPASAVTEKLARGYAASLDAAGAAECRRWGYGFATFADHAPISPFQRSYFADQLWSDTPADADPFDPGFATPRSTGARSLYRYHRAVARGSRLLRRMFAG